MPSINLPEYELVGGAISILKNDGVRQWDWDDIPYMKPPTSETYPPGDLRSIEKHFQATHLARGAIGLRRRGDCPCQGVLHLHGAQPRKLNPWGKKPGKTR